MLTSIGGQPSQGASSSLQSALQMDQSNNQQQQQQQPQPKRRRKNNSDGDADGTQSEPRRLRRSHEACARCRGKKIKCDSKHPRCSACATAGVDCQQEDRHRQTLTPRGHTEHLEHLLAQCQALLKRHIPNFELENIDEILAREGIDPNPVLSFQFSTPRQPPAHQPVYPTGPHMVPYASMVYPGPFPPPAPASPYATLHPAFYPTEQPVRNSNDIKGQDPKGHDMSNAAALAKNFGVTSTIINNIPIGMTDREDLAVGSSGLTSGRDRAVQEATLPRDTAHWRTVSIRRTSNASNIPLSLRPPPATTSVEVWLPKDRNMVQFIVGVYFQRLNVHRPVFARAEFEKRLDDLYAGVDGHDPGLICSLYLILALGTLSELNRRAVELDVDGSKDQYGYLGPAVHKKLMPAEWPEHDEFFERALSVKPDLRVSISSLQALILLHWYLYTERQGRTLWRLVGSLVRLSVELGLHHDPTTQPHPTEEGKGLFTEEECQLRIRLWGIILIHDRGTSILLGRPLAIGLTESNTPRPSRPKAKNPGIPDFSEHFELSHAVADIQGDIINSLYSPTRYNGDSVMRHATRIIKSMLEFRKTLPDKYQKYFGGTEDWPMESRSKLVLEITEDEGLTLLKVGICRILLLRALFNLKDLSYAQRSRALVDAIVTSHNIIIVHSQLIRFPDIGFFTSPVPLHISAMVILYGHMSKCDRLPVQTALEDIWLALDMLPRFRWRWERKDVAGGHPLLAQLAERVLGVSLHTVGPATHPVLMAEPDWEDDNMLSPTHSQQNTPTLAASYTNGPVTYGPHPKSAPNGVQQSSNSGHNGHPMHGGQPHLIDVPPALFYPFYPEGQPSAHPQDYSSLVAAAAAPPSHDTYMSEERPVQIPIWIQNQQQQQQQQQQQHAQQRTGPQPYAIPPNS